jgi:aspartate kinase
MSTIVLKFGGAAFASSDQFSKIAELILKKQFEFERIVVVVSAMANVTDELIHLAHSVHKNPPQRELDMLISIGERASMALLSMAIQAQGKKAISFTGSQSGILTNNEHSQAKIIEVRPSRLLDYLSRGYIVIVAGFQGVSLEKEITTLGRGGSDTSAVALGVSLGAERVIFYKDVGAIYEADPKHFPLSKICSKLTYEEALFKVDPRRAILHPRCIELARLNSLPLSVCSYITGEEGTRIECTAATRPEAKIYEKVL